MTVEWDKVDDIELPVTGYILQVADFGSVNFKTIYDGSNAPATRQFTKDGFATAARYTFRALTVNFNGLSEPSEEFTFNACLAPSGMPSPFRIDEGSSTGNLRIGWTAPEDAGGCPLTGYQIFRDDGQGGPVTTEVNEVDDPLLTGDPTLRQATITNLEADSEGFIYRVMVRVHNREGFADSPFFRIMNAGFPEPLTTAPVLLSKDAVMISVQLPLASDNDSIFTYELQIDNGVGGQFVTFAGNPEYSMETRYTIENLVTGRTYRLRYRVLNFVGWSQFSPILFVHFATVPVAPGPVSFVSATDTTITLNFVESEQNGGSEITAYELWRDNGYESPEFEQVLTYSDNSMTHTVSSLTSGTIYSFKYRAKNDVGYSEFSVARRFAASAPPVKPEKPTKNMDKSSHTSIFVEWAESLPSAAPILGYKLYMSAGTSEYEVIYSSRDNPLVRQFNVQNLVTGVLY